MQVIQNTKENLEMQVAQHIVQTAQKILQEKSICILGIVGGRSVVGIFKHLKTLLLPWEKVHIFMADERLAPLDAEDSNFKMASETFIGELKVQGKLPEENVHPFLYKPQESGSGIPAYSKELQKYGGSFDILLLSSGEDGHVGALYPNHPSIRNTNAEYYMQVDNSPKPPPQRMSASPQLMKRSKNAIVLFVGESKKQAYTNFKDQSITLEKCPAKIVQSIQNSLVATDLI